MKTLIAIFWGVLLGVSMFSCSTENRKAPKAATIFKGTIYSADSVPLPNVPILITGIKQENFLTPIPNFSIDTVTDEKGEFSFNYRIPDGTASVKFKPFSGFGIYDPDLNLYFSEIYVENQNKGRKYIQSCYIIRGNWGKTVNIKVYKIYDSTNNN